MKNDPTSPSRPKLEVLDALRGFCALVVLLLHFTEPYEHGHGSPLVPHGYLPVEYFFILTGFTFVYAYDSRWAAMSVWAFFRRRLLRMHPLVVIGTLFGAMIYLIVPECSCMNGYGMGRFLLAFVWCCTLIPMPAALGWAYVHVFQGPMWTMFYIYVANVVYAFVLRHLKTWMLGCLALVAAVFSYYVGWRYGDFGLGWRFDHDQIVVAFGRLAFPVLIGMFIARKGWRINTGRTGLWICLTVLTAVFVMPLPATPQILGLMDATLAVFIIPLVLLCGVGGTIPHPKLAAVCRFMGSYSFPLYATHYPLREIQRLWIAAHPEASMTLHIAAGLAFAFFAFVNGWVAMRIVGAFDDWVHRRGASA